MSWLNLNESLNSLKGQITNFASEVLSEGTLQNSSDTPAVSEQASKELSEKFHKQELEIAALKKLTDELQASLQAERLSRKNGHREEESSWYWDPPPQTKPDDTEHKYKVQIQALQDELSAIKEHGALDVRPYDEEELHRLREENKHLTTNLEDLDNQHQQAMERLLALKKELQKNFEVLKHDYEDLKSSNDDYVDQIAAYKTKTIEKDKEIEDLSAHKTDYDTLNHKYQNLERIYSVLRENAEKFQEENQELHEENFRLQEQLTKLEHDVELATKHVELSNSVPRDTYDELLKEFNDLKSRRSNNRVHLDEINIDDNAKSVIENLKRDISELKHKLAQKETECAGKTDNSNIIRPDKIMQLYNKYVNFELPVDYVGEIPSSDDEILMHKLENSFKALQSYKQEIQTLENKLSEKSQTLNHLQNQVDDLTTENDFLSTDIHHFEREMNEMKKNNDFLISEIAALKNTSKLEPIIEGHEDNLVKLETELADCNKINKTFESELKKIEHELMEVRSEKDILQSSLDDLKNKYQAMLNELEVCKTQTKALEELEDYEKIEKYQNALSELDEIRNQLTMYSTRNEKLLIDMQVLENDKVLLTKQVDDLKHDLHEKSVAFEELKFAKSLVENKIQDLQGQVTEHEKIRITNENENAILRQKNNEMENKLKNCSVVTHSKKIQANVSDINILNVNESFKNDVNVLKDDNTKLASDNTTDKAELEKEKQRNVSLQQQIDCNNTELANLKTEMKTLIEKKLQLETELTLTDQKILKLEEDFDKLLTDLSEKDSIIDSLNATISQNKIALTNLSQNVTDLENSVDVKNHEISILRTNLEEITDKYNHISQYQNETSTKYEEILKEKEESLTLINALKEQLNAKESQELKTKIDEFEKTILTYKHSLEQKDKEIKELNQSILELTDKIRSNESTHLDDELVKLVKEKETIAQNVTELQEKLADRDKELEEIRPKHRELEKSCTEYKAIIENCTKEKGELINLVNLKHNESIQYHNEIQRLNHVILEQTNEFKKSIESKQDVCSQCESLRTTLKEKDAIIMALNQNSTDFDNTKVDLQALNETVRSLTEKCDNLEKNLAIQLETVKRLTADNLQLSDQDASSKKELERLRQHLMETEEGYTQELMAAEVKLSECQARLHQVEDRAKQTSTVYTSNSIRANQEVETLRNQIRLLEKQREEAQGRLGAAEDARERSEAALTNLQLVLEQFQLDKERDIDAATVKLQNKMEDIKKENGALKQEVMSLNVKLEEALAGLQAASRLGDQLETKTGQIHELKEQVRTLQTSVAAAEERYYKAISNQQDKVDKNLVKNLVINYVMTQGQSAHNRSQVLRILSTVLDFNQQECERVSLSRSSAGDGLATEFVRFLEKESRPVTLPDMMGLATRSLTPSRKNSGLGPQPSPYELGHKRNPSTGSNNLLFQNIDNVETSSQLSFDTSSVHSDTKSTDKEHRVASLGSPVLENAGVNQTRNTEGAILKHVLKDM